MEKDYYRILGIPRHADTAEIKSAYRRLARAYHPDTNPDGVGGERFRDISEAYQALTDPEARRAYDRNWDAMHSPRSSERLPDARGLHPVDEMDAIASPFSAFDRLFERWAFGHFITPEDSSDEASPAPQSCPSCHGRSGNPTHVCLVCFGRG